MSNVPQGSQQYTTINDFTPGVQRFSRGGYAPTYPLAQGSAASAYRCYAQPGIGLCPFPKYTPVHLIEYTAGAGVGWSSVMSVCSLGGVPSDNDLYLPGSEALLAATLDYNGTDTTCHIYSASGGPAGLTVHGSVYSHAVASAEPMVFNNLTAFFTNDSGNYNIVGVLIDPTYTTTGHLEWVTVPSWASTSANSAVASFVTNPSSIPITSGSTFTQSSRLGVFNNIQQGNLGAGGNTPLGGVAVTGVFLSDLQAPTNIVGPSFFMGDTASNLVGGWGSINAGEFVIIFQGQGAVLVYGDIGFPSAVINLPGVNGTGLAAGPSVSSPIGLVYLTDFDGAYVWNGGETSQKISSQIPDDNLIRNQVPVNPPASGTNPLLTHHDVWANWVMCANNWMYDCLTNAWWQVEDPTVANFQTHTASHLSPRFFYSTDGWTATNNTWLNIYQWDRSVPQSNYVWTSNPIAEAPGYLVTLNSVEVVVSNPSATQATVTVTPTVPAGQTPLGTTAPQSVSFTIPPTTTASRQSVTLGYTDFNVEISVVASNSNGSNQAPIIHEIIVGWEASTTSGSGA